MADPNSSGLHAIVLVAAIAIGAAALISASHEISSERIERNEAERIIRALQDVLGPARYDNDLVASQVWATDPDLLGTVDPVRVYLATRNGAPVAAIFAAVAPRGYSGTINLLVGIDAQGVVQGVRVTSHRETRDWGIGSISRFPIGSPDSTVQVWVRRRPRNGPWPRTAASSTPSPAPL